MEATGKPLLSPPSVPPSGPTSVWATNLQKGTAPANSQPFSDTRVHTSVGWAALWRTNPGKRRKPMWTGEIWARSSKCRCVLHKGCMAHVAGSGWGHTFGPVDSAVPGGRVGAVAAEGPSTGSSKADSPGQQLQLCRPVVVLHLTPSLCPGLCLFSTSGRHPVF